LLLKEPSEFILIHPSSGALHFTTGLGAGLDLSPLVSYT
jgi:hypothetical protein